MGIATLYVTTFPSSGDRLLVWRLFYSPFLPPASWTEINVPALSSSLQIASTRGRVYQEPPDWHFPLAAAPTGDSITDSGPLGMDNPRLNPPDSVINDMSTGYDPCSLAVMLLVEPRGALESWRGRPVQLCTGTAKQPLGTHRQSLTGPLLATRHAVYIYLYTVEYTNKQSQSVATVIYILCEQAAAFTKSVSLFRMWTLAFLYNTNTRVLCTITHILKGIPWSVSV